MAAVLSAVLALAACGSGAPRGPLALQQSTVQPWGFVGMASDEPRALRAARDALARPATAVDAAVALYFANAVTLPSTAGLGGGGTCLVFDPQTARTEAFDFTPRRAASGSAVVPVGVRAMAAMHARFGKVRWEQLLAPAENLARFGFPLSRALATDLADGGAALGADPEARRLFLRGGAAPLGEGDMLVQPDLAATLGSLRGRGAGEMHVGALARRIAEGASAAGVALAPADLERAVPMARSAIVLRYESYDLHFSPPAGLGGLEAAQLWAMLAPRWRAAPADERPHLFVEAAARQAADELQWREADLSSVAILVELTSERHAAGAMAGYRPTQVTAAAPPLTPAEAGAFGASFVIADRQGMTVACATSMGRRFGSGRMIPATGLFLASPADEAPSAAAMMVTGRLGGGFLSLTDISGQVIMAAAAGGGRSGPAALTAVALRSLIDARGLEEAIAAPRVDRGDGVVPADAEGGEQRHSGLAARGYAVRAVPAVGRVNALSCPDGLNSDQTKCRVRSDPRAHGMALGAD